MTKRLPRSFTGTRRQLQAGVDFECGPTGIVAAATTGKRFGQVRRQADGSGVEDINALEALQQGNGGGSGIEETLQSRRQDESQTVCGGWGEALIECLGGNVGTEICGEVGEAVEAGVGIVKPSECQGLHEEGTGEFSLSLYGSALSCGVFGFGSQEGL